MKTKYPSFLGIFAALLMVAAFVVPVHLTMPSAASADPGIMKWDTVTTPNSVAGKNDVLNPQSPWDTDWGSEILSMAVGSDGNRIAYVVRTLSYLTATEPKKLHNVFYLSSNSGMSATITRYTPLTRNSDWQTMSNDGTGVRPELFQVAIAQDDPNFIVVSSSAGTKSSTNFGPTLLWVTTDGGSNWDLACDGSVLNGGINGTETIRDIAVSMDYGGKRDIGFVTVDSDATKSGRFFVRSSTGFTTWSPQLNPVDTTGTKIDYFALRFSPTYNGDASVALVYADKDATYFNVAQRDLNRNDTSGYAYGATGVEVRDPSGGEGSSPGYSELNNVDLELPSDFSGQSASLRRAYISLDAVKSTATPNMSKDGIFRIDDTTPYMLMDTSSTKDKSIYSIAYFGTYASGKLLAGERKGYSCTAEVPTWFTDSPTTCPIPCWYPALKPTTGAGNGTCATGTKNGIGAALVGWNADGSLGYAATGALPYMPTTYAGGDNNLEGDVAGWFSQQLANPIFPNDESAFAISRNNGETWNQTILIDTTIDWFNDVAVAPDCTTIYLTSVNRNTGAAGMCNEFDSVWRSSINPNVVAPLPAVPPLGSIWERVYSHVTSGNCGIKQSDLPIIRVVPSCTDKKDGEIVGWAAQNAFATGTTGGVMAWSPDFGDFWATITPRNRVQDFAFESSTVLYTYSPEGLVQRLPYTGTAWSTNLPNYDPTIGAGHTIVAMPEGKVLVGGAEGSTYTTAYSATKGETWVVNNNAISGHSNTHVIFDVDFANNSFIYAGDDKAGGVLGTVYRNTYPSFSRWVDGDMMSEANGAVGIFWPTTADPPPHPIGIFGLAQAWTGNPQPALYAAHDNLTTGNSNRTDVFNSAVCRTLEPRNGMPKPGIVWDCLDIFAPLSTSGVMFTLEPTSLKYCGCCTLDTNTTLYAIDDERGVEPRTRTDNYPNLLGRFNALTPKNPPAPAPTNGVAGYTPTMSQGMLWAYTDCLAKKGPVLKSPADKYLVGADPVTGRNQQIDLSWEQICLATVYQLDIAKDKDFTLRVTTNAGAIGNAVPTWVAPTTTTPGGTIVTPMIGAQLQHIMVAPPVVTSPATWLAPGALPEAGAIYYWRIRAAQSATSQWAYSPWSEARTFTVKAGFIVNTPYYGVQLLSPNNGCLSCKVKPASFSWSPWKEATKYEFVLAKDSEMTQVVKQATTTTTGYEYDGQLDYNTNYFWRVRALEVNGQEIPSDWSATFSFQTESAPAPEAPPPAAPSTPMWVWVIIALGAILVIVTLILIFKTRRV